VADSALEQIDHHAGGPLQARTSAIRETLRASWSPRYRGGLHAAFTASFGLAVFAIALSRVHAPTLAQLSVVPLTFLYANLIEWRMHKGPMHHRTQALSLVHKRHTLEHHRFFTREEMALEGHRDVKMVLFPPLLIFFFALFAAPVGFALGNFFGVNVAALFVACAIGYFLLYESLHLSYHLPARSRVTRLPILRALARHHALHHELSRMTEGNFNVTFPICDSIFGTRLQEMNPDSSAEET
jgi:hypothetical protein